MKQLRRAQPRAWPFKSSRFLSIPAMLLLLNGLTLSSMSARELKISINGIRNAKGSIAALAFTSAQGFPDQANAAVASVRVPAQEGNLVLTLRNLPEGKLAITILHDENNDNRLNRNMFGIPLEGVAVSGQPLGNRPPQFLDSLVTPLTTMNLMMKYW